jgi:hypothetical protein
VRCYSLCLLMLVLFVPSLAMLSQAQETKTMHTGATPMVHMPGTPDCFCDGDRTGRSQQRCMHPEDEGERGMRRPMALASSHGKHHDGERNRRNPGEG